MGALAAGAASLGLIWWLAAPQAPAPAQVAPIRAPAAPQVPKAPAQADPAQVARAFEAVQDAFADGGADGLVRADADCAAALKADGRVLDYCLAFDLFAAAVAPQVAPQAAGADPEATRIAAAREALPLGADPAARLAAVRALMRQASLGQETPAVRPKPRPVKVSAAKRPPVSQAERQARRRVAARVLHAAFTTKAPADGCERRATLAERLVCGDAKVWAADGRMRRAYDAALAAGADPLKVDAEQARFHAARDSAKDAAAVEALYDRRTRELEDLTAPH